MLEDEELEVLLWAGECDIWCEVRGVCGRKWDGGVVFEAQWILNVVIAQHDLM